MIIAASNAKIVFRCPIFAAMKRDPLMLDLAIPFSEKKIQYSDKIMLVGSCFAQHISDKLVLHCFDICSSPNGIIYSPLSISQSLKRSIDGHLYKSEDLFYQNEIWNSWAHHSVFSDIDKQVAIDKMNAELAVANATITDADWLIISMGTAYQYYLQKEKIAVSNNHRMSADLFEKKLLSIDEMFTDFSKTIHLLKAKNPKLKILVTVSPVRHLRDGIVENNRSKARLIELSHLLCEAFEMVHYFPAYELLIDVLRDYRFYENDFAHPSETAIDFVWNKFLENCFETETVQKMEIVFSLQTAKNHRVRFPETTAHKSFCRQQIAKAISFQNENKYINLKEIVDYFERQIMEQKPYENAR